MSDLVSAIVYSTDPETRESLRAALAAELAPSLAVEDVQTLARGVDRIQGRKPDMAFLDLSTNPAEVMQTAASLRGSVPGTRLVAIYNPLQIPGHIVLSELFLEAMRQGFFDFLRTPVSPQEMHAVVARFRDARLGVERPSAPGTVVSFLSSKGGVGKTTLAVNLAVALSRRAPGQVAVVDASFDLGNTREFLALSPRYSFYDAYLQRDRLDRDMLLGLMAQHDPTGIQLLDSPRRVEQMKAIEDQGVTQVMLALQKAFRYVVVDTIPVLSPVLLAIGDLSDHLVVVTESLVPAITGTHRMLALLEEAGYDMKRIKVALNRFAHAAWNIEPQLAAGTLRRDIDYLLPYDPRLHESANMGIPYIQSHPESEFSQGVERLARDVCGNAVAPQPRQGFFQRLLSLGSRAVAAAPPASNPLADRLAAAIAREPRPPANGAEAGATAPRPAPFVPAALAPPPAIPPPQAPPPPPPRTAPAPADSGPAWMDELAEAERLETQKREAERREAGRREAEWREAHRREAERMEAERLEAERLEAVRQEAERLESERLGAERLEAERLEAERLEAERQEAERIEAERFEAERLESERQEAERVETERREAEAAALARERDPRAESAPEPLVVPAASETPPSTAAGPAPAPGEWVFWRRRRGLVARVRMLLDKLDKSDELDVNLLGGVVGELFRMFDRLSPVDFLDLTYWSEPTRYLPRHCLNVAKLGMFLARSLGLPRDEIEQIAIAGLLHDLGMMRVHDTVFTKHADLNEEEWRDVKGHPVEGAILLTKEAMLRDVVTRVILEHHEKPDGTGYPRGKKKEEIHLYARIINVVDTYEAMVSPRAYRLPMLPCNAMRQILDDGARGMLDWDVVNAFAQALSLYPIGSYLKLDTGEVARVVRANAMLLDKPIIAILSDNRRNMLEKPVEIDLAMTDPIPKFEPIAVPI